MKASTLVFRKASISSAGSQVAHSADARFTATHRSQGQHVGGSGSASSPRSPPSISFHSISSSLRSSAS